MTAYADAILRGPWLREHGRGARWMAVRPSVPPGLPGPPGRPGPPAARDAALPVPRLRVDWAAFAGAAVLAPLALAFGGSLLIVPIAAAFWGLPTYLLCGLPAALVAAEDWERSGRRRGVWSFALAGAVANLFTWPVLAVLLSSAPLPGFPQDLDFFPPFAAAFGFVFGPILGLLFGWLYRSFAPPFYRPDEATAAAPADQSKT